MYPLLNIAINYHTLQAIRKLREEVEQLHAAESDQNELERGRPSGTSTIQWKECITEKLRQCENLIMEMNKSWEDKLLETERIQEERQKALEDMGISIEAAGIGVHEDKFYLVNLSSDPSMNKLLVCYIKVNSSSSYNYY